MNGSIEQHITTCIRLIVSECYHLFHVTFHLLTLLFTVIVDYIFYYFGMDDSFVHAWGRCLHTSHSRTKRKEVQYGKNVQLPYIYKGSCTKIPCFYSSVVFVSAERDKNTMEECINPAIFFNVRTNIKIIVFADIS